MANNSEKLHSCTSYIGQPRNFHTENCNALCSPNAAINLKPFADLLLQRNWRCNTGITKDENQSNFTTEKVDKKLHNNSTASKHRISTQELKEFLGEDWDNYKNNPELLELWANLLFKNHLMEQGKLPDNFTATTQCNLCGYVYVPPALVNGGNVLGCPWCWNRVRALPIPNPADSQQYLMPKNI